MGAEHDFPRDEEETSLRVMTGLSDGGIHVGTGPSRASSNRGTPAGARDDHEIEGLTSSYASLNVDEGARQFMQQMWRCQWHGRIMEWRTPCGAVFIGPHWYASIVMLSFILGVGGFFTSAAVNQTQFFTGLGVTFMTTTSFLRCFAADPGIIEAKPRDLVTESAAVEQGASAEPQRRFAGAAERPGRRCNTCNIIQPRGTQHCEFCGVCVEGYDHHCPWMGKCIGKKNLFSFYTFCASAMISLGVVFTTTLLSPTQIASAQHRKILPAA